MASFRRATIVAACVGACFMGSMAWETPSVSPSSSIPPSPSRTPTPTKSMSRTPTGTPTNTGTPSNTPTQTPSQTPTPSNTPSNSPTPSTTASPSPTPSMSPYRNSVDFLWEQDLTFPTYLERKSYIYSLLRESGSNTVLAPEDGERWESFKLWFPALTQWLLSSRCFDRLDYFLKMSILPRAIDSYEVWTTNAPLSRRLSEEAPKKAVINDMSPEALEHIPAEVRKLTATIPHNLWQGSWAPWEVIRIGCNSSVTGGADQVVCDSPPHFNFAVSPQWTSEFHTTNGVVVTLDSFMSPAAEPKMAFPTVSASRYIFSNPSLSTFSKLINVTNFCGEKQPWRDACMALNQVPKTIFAPVDEGFNLMTHDALQYLFNMSCEQCRKDAQAVIMYHLIGSAYETSYLRTGDLAELACTFHNVSLNTRQGEKLLVRTPACSSLTADNRCTPIQLDLSCEPSDIGVHAPTGLIRIYGKKSTTTHEELNIGNDWDTDYTDDLLNGNVDPRVTNWWDVLLYYRSVYPDEEWLQTFSVEFETAVDPDKLAELKAMSVYALLHLPTSDVTILRARTAVLTLMAMNGGSVDVDIMHDRRLTERQKCGATTVLPWADIETLSGMIHKVNRVLIPPSIAARMPPAYVSGVTSGGVGNIKIITDLAESGASTTTMAMSAAAAVAAAGAVTAVSYQG